MPRPRSRYAPLRNDSSRASNASDHVTQRYSCLDVTTEPIFAGVARRVHVVCFEARLSGFEDALEVTCGRELGFDRFAFVNVSRSGLQVVLDIRKLFSMRHGGARSPAGRTTSSP
jgi:hypothetical protein